MWWKLNHTICMLAIAVGGCSPNQELHQRDRVHIDEFSMIIHVEGVANNTGDITVKKGTTILQLMDIVGLRRYPDLRPYSMISRIELSKVVEGQRVSVRVINLKKIRANPSLDIRLEGGELIRIPEELGL